MEQGQFDTAMAPGEQVLRWIQWLMQNGGNAVQAGTQPLNTTPSDPAAQYALSRMSQPTPLENLAQLPASPLINDINNTRSAQAAAAQPGNNPPPQNGPTSAQSNAAPEQPADQAERKSAAPKEDQTGDDATRKGPDQPPAGGPGGAPAQAGGQQSPDMAMSSLPSSPAYPGIPAGARNEQRFGYDPTQDSPGSWASRVFTEGLKDAGTNLYDPILSGSPWGRFLASRYTPELESRLITGEMNGGVGPGGEASFAHNTLAGLAQGGGSPAGGIGDLASAARNLASYAGGATFDNPAQTAALGRMANDTNAQYNMILGGLRGATGGFGMQYAQQLLGDMQRQYANDPSQYQPGTFAQAALAKLGIR